MTGTPKADDAATGRRDYVFTGGGLPKAADPILSEMNTAQLDKAIAQVRRLMQEASSRMEFLEAAQYRDEMFKLDEIKLRRQKSEAGKENIGQKTN